ncbi:MAG TPA: hypothetical protein VNI55_07515, partial [Gaiellaceae bacterium]|nr:hypothetical protein [Gaiellaceae bacterium]
MADLTFNGYNVRMRFRALRLLALLTLVGSVLALPGAVANAAFPGSNGLIAFERGGNIFTVTTDSSHTVSSSAVVVGAIDPAWSPSGQKLAFSQAGSIKVLTIGGSTTGALDTGTAPTWSPDGTMLAYEKAGDIWVISSSGGTPRNLSASGGGGVEPDDDPAWSPADDEIAFTRTTGGDAEIFIMDAPATPADVSGGLNQVALTTAVSNETLPSYEPGGDRIAYTSDRNTVSQIYSISIFGGSETRVTNSITNDSAPAYSPDGTLISFARAGAGIYTTRSSGSGETPITAGADTNPDWQPGAPVNSILPAISGSYTQGSLLTASPGTFSSAGSFEYQWLRCDGSGDGCSDIPGETASTYRVTSDDVGSSFRVRVTANSSTGSSSATSNATPPIVGPQPRNVVPPKVIVPGVTGVPVAGVALSSSVGTWTGAGTLTYTYQWKKCQPKDGPCYRILLTSAQNSTFVPTVDLIGWSLRVEVTATNFAGSATEQSESTPLVVANAPVATVRPRISISTTNPTVGQELTADTGSWTGFGLTFSYQWRRCDPPGTLPSCVPIPGANTSAYTTTEADLGVTLRVYVTASGTGGVGTAFSDHTFPTIPAPRFAPSMSAAPTITGDVEIGGTLTATRGTWA